MNNFNNNNILSNFAVNLTYYINKFKNVNTVYYEDGSLIESSNDSFSYKSFTDFCNNAFIDVKAIKAITTGSAMPRLNTVKKIIDFLHLFDKNITLESMLSGIIQ